MGFVKRKKSRAKQGPACYYSYMEISSLFEKCGFSYTGKIYIDGDRNAPRVAFEKC